MLRDRSLIPLSHQHHNGLALCVLTNRSIASDSSEENRARLAAKIVDRFELEIANHFEIEENTLFPEIERALGPSPLVRELLAEHRELERLTGALRTDPAADTLLAFTALLHSHIRKEEADLFEDIQKRLPRETLDALGVAIESRVVRICL
jgi:hemerythrin-like domain-containing protein